MWASRKVSREEVEPDDAPIPISLPTVHWLERTPPDDADAVKEKAVRFAEFRTIRAGMAAWEGIKAKQTFSAWVAIGKALRAGRDIALRESGSKKPKGPAYTTAHHAWLARVGFHTMEKGLRCRAAKLIENLEEIEAWRATLSDEERRRLNEPTATLRRWRASMASPGDRSPADLRRDAQAAWKRFVSCADRLPPDLAADLWAAVRRRSA